MLLAAILLVGLAAGYVLGGRVRNLATLRVRWWWLAPIALAMQAVPVPTVEGGGDELLGLGLLLSSYVLLLVVAAVNIRRVGFVFILVGIALNLVVIAPNRGMPVSASALRRAGDAESVEALRGAAGKHHLATGDDVLLPLSDVIPVPLFEAVVSVGDVVAYSGAAIVLVAAMRKRRARA